SFAVAHRSPPAGNLVSDHARTDSRAIYNDAQITSTTSDRKGYKVCVIWVIDGLSRIGTEVLEVMTQIGDGVFQKLFDFKTAVVGAKPDLELAAATAAHSLDRDPEIADDVRRQGSDNRHFVYPESIARLRGSHLSLGYYTLASLV